MALLVGRLVVAQILTLVAGTTLPGGIICATTMLLLVLQNATMVMKRAIIVTSQILATMSRQAQILPTELEHAVHLAISVVMEHFFVCHQNRGAC